MRTLEDIIIARGDLEKIYGSDVALVLWRAVNVASKGSISNPLYPDLESRELPNGRIRLADVSTYEKDGVKYVKSVEGQGTSLVDKKEVFGTKHWEYVVIPAKTHIPEALIITKDHMMPRQKCWHYSISPNYDMKVSDFLKALDQLAINAKIKTKGIVNAKS